MLGVIIDENHKFVANQMQVYALDDISLCTSSNYRANSYWTILLGKRNDASYLECIPHTRFDCACNIGEEETISFVCKCNKLAQLED